MLITKRFNQTSTGLRFYSTCVMEISRHDERVSADKYQKVIYSTVVNLEKKRLISKDNC